MPLHNTDTDTNNSIQAGCMMQDAKTSILIGQLVTEFYSGQDRHTETNTDVSES